MASAALTYWPWFFPVSINRRFKDAGSQQINLTWSGKSRSPDLEAQLDWEFWEKGESTELLGEEKDLSIGKFSLYPRSGSQYYFFEDKLGVRSWTRSIFRNMSISKLRDLPEELLHFENWLACSVANRTWMSWDASIFVEARTSIRSAQDEDMFWIIRF